MIIAKDCTDQAVAMPADTGSLSPSLEGGGVGGLPAMPMGSANCDRVLDALLRRHNHEPGARKGSVSTKTMADRRCFLGAFFRELHHETRHKTLDPRELTDHHVAKMVRRWLKRDLSTATIHTYLSFLRTFATWIGRDGMVRAPECYVGARSPHARRSPASATDRSWGARHSIVVERVAEIAAVDPWVGLQVELCAVFGLRSKEALEVCPHEAIVPRERASAEAVAACPLAGSFLQLSCVTRSERTRDIPVASPSQRDLVSRLLAAVPAGGLVGPPGRTKVQNRRRFYAVLSKFGDCHDEPIARVDDARHPKYRQGASTPGLSPHRSAAAMPKRPRADPRA